MITKQHTYRGVPYQPADHEKASPSFVEHIYRGKRYNAPLQHKMSEPDENIELNYRGSIYRHRKQQANFTINN